MSKFIFIIIVSIMIISSFTLLWLLDGDETRLGRDLRMKLQNNELSDEKVIGFHCGFKGFEPNYKKVNSKEFCGDIEVITDCKFTNHGDYCQIKEVNQ